MGELIISNERFGYSADDRIVVTLAATIAEIWAETRWPVTLLASFPHDGQNALGHEAGVTDVFATYDPSEPGFGVLRTQRHPDDVAIDPEYAQRVRESAKRLGNWIVTDAHDEVITDWAYAKELIRAAINDHRERGRR